SPATRATTSGTVIDRRRSAAPTGSAGSTPASRAARSYAAVVRTNASGTRNPARWSSPRFAPFPPATATSAAPTAETGSASAPPGNSTLVDICAPDPTPLTIRASTGRVLAMALTQRPLVTRRDGVRIFSEDRIVAVVRVPSAEIADRTARLLAESGVRLIEITLTVPDAFELIERLSTDASIADRVAAI